MISSFQNSTHRTKRHLPVELSAIQHTGKYLFDAFHISVADLLVYKFVMIIIMLDVVLMRKVIFGFRANFGGRSIKVWGRGQVDGRNHFASISFFFIDGVFLEIRKQPLNEGINSTQRVFQNQ